MMHAANPQAVRTSMNVGTQEHATHDMGMAASRNASG
jgi:hypothetical protein